MGYWSVRWTPGPEFWIQNLAESICCVLVKNSLLLQCPLHPGVYMGTGKLPGMHDEMVKPFGFSTDFTLLLPNGDAKA